MCLSGLFGLHPLHVRMPVRFGDVFNFFVAVGLLGKRLDISCRMVSPISESGPQSHTEMTTFSLSIYL